MSRIQHHRTTDRIADILYFTACREGGSTLSEIASGLEAPVATIQTLANGLVAVGFLDRQGKRYRLGPAPYLLTLHTKQAFANSVTHEDLVTLASEDDFTVVLGIRVGDNVVILDDAGNNPELQYRAQTHAQYPLLNRPIGWAILAALEDATLHEYLALHPHQDLVDNFLSQLEINRASGVVTAIIDGVERNPGGNTETGLVCAAVKDARGSVIGAVAIGQEAGYFRQNSDHMASLLLSHIAHWSERSSRSKRYSVSEPRDGISKAKRASARQIMKSQQDWGLQDAQK